MQSDNNLISTLRGEALSLGGDLIDVSDYVEGDLGQVIVLARHDGLEPGDGLGDGHELAGVVGEHLGDLEYPWVRKWLLMNQKVFTWKG